MDAALGEIESLPGRHLYFLDDHLFGNPRFAAALFDGMRGMGCLWQAAATVNSVLRPGLLEKAVEAGLRSLFVGFETLHPGNLEQEHKMQNFNLLEELSNFHLIWLMDVGPIPKISKQMSRRNFIIFRVASFPKLSKDEIWNCEIYNTK